jgi:thiol-disulfide isomerase/thioredoxin
VFTCATNRDERNGETMNLNKVFSRLPLPVESRMPTLAGATEWLNSDPLAPTDLAGKVVIINFWTYTCINWLRTLPYIRAWANAYAEHGLVVVGVHTPEFGVEHDVDNVRRAIRDMGIEYPVAIDNDYAVWNTFANEYWPALYIADHEGRIRHHHFGEGGYEKSEAITRHLLADAGPAELPDDLAPAEARGIELAADLHNVRSFETYVGFERSAGFASPEGIAYDDPQMYTVPSDLRANQWALAGEWTLGREAAVSNQANGRIAYRFHARDLHLILAPPAPTGSARFRVSIDGRAPGDAHGLDVDEEGNGVVAEPRLYQLIRQSGHIADRRFEIEFEDPGAAALCFTFG